jgi:primosomal protein N' (replication factor Y)
MHASVLFPINAEAFTYIVPDELQGMIKPGCRVEAPFKRGRKTGIVVGFGKKKLPDSSIKLKEIKSLLDDKPLVPENLLKLIEWTAQYYMSSSGLALKNAVPSAFFTGKKAGKSRITYDEDIKKEKGIKLNSEQRDALAAINEKDEGVFLLHGVTGSGKTEVYINAVK